jgi:hypothetical protein
MPLKKKFILFFTLILCALLGESFDYAQQSCTDQASCYAYDQRAANETIRVQWGNSGMPQATSAVADCIQNTCSYSPVGVTSFATYSVDFSKFTTGQGFGPVWTGSQPVMGYPELIGGNSTQVVPSPLFTTYGFTFEVTAVIPPAGDTKTLTLLKLKNAGNEVWSASWSKGQLIITRKTPNGSAILANDRPWDTNQSVIDAGLPMAPTTENYTRTAYPTQARLVEFYFTFRTDGKLVVDLFNVDETQQDQWLEKLIEEGLPVSSYPGQPGAPWNAVTYSAFSVVRVGAGGEADANHGLLQYVYFDVALYPQEVLAYHRMNEFFGGVTKSSTSLMNYGDSPCNTGNYLNIASTLTVSTPCGHIIGIQQ